jgi:Ca-activated chloride channel family protein
VKSWLSIRARCAVRSALLSLTAGVFALAWSRPAPQGSLQSTAELVKVDVRVADRRGNFLSSLAPTDFRVLDNGIEQTTVFFTSIEAPAQILVMVETGPAVYLIRNEHLAAAYALLDSLAPGDQLALACYDQNPRQIMAFTSDKSAWLSALGEIKYNLGMGDLNFYGSLSQVLDWLRPIPGKRALVILTTGLDSSQPSGWDPLIEKLRREDIVLFPVALGGSLRPPTRAEPFRRKKTPANNSDQNKPASGTESPLSFTRADRDLRSLAAITGGRAYFPRSSGDFVAIYRGIAAALRHQYILGFVPSHDGQYHALSVEVVPGNGLSAKPEDKRAQYQVFSRAGYLAPGP